MLTLLLTALGGFGGIVSRLLPEIIALWNKKTDNAHELAMLDKQLEIEKQKGANRTSEIDHQHDANMGELQLKGNIDAEIALIKARAEAIKAQFQKTGIRIVDIANFLARPVTLYYFLAMHGLTKIAMFAIALSSGLNAWESILKMWSVEDAAILSFIINFYFVGRVFDKKTA